MACASFSTETISRWIFSRYRRAPTVEEEEASEDERSPLTASYIPQFSYYSAETKARFISLVIGQVLSLILCLSAIISVYLTTTFDLHMPTTQNFLFYFVLSSIFTSKLVSTPDALSSLKSRWWKYLFVAAADAEANYLVVKAYQYTTLTSVQLLDCFTIPTVLVLSRVLLHVRYKWVHIFGVVICLWGVACLVWADIQEGIPQGQGTERLIGDVLCLSGAFLYGVSNVAQEFLVKTFDAVEFLGMVGLFGCLITGIQAIILESNQVTAAVIHGSSAPIFLLIGFAFTQFVFYMLAAFLIKKSGATVYNLSILTADFYSLLVGICLFDYNFHVLYFLSFVLILVGVIVFSVKPTMTVVNAYQSDNLMTRSNLSARELLSPIAVSTDMEQSREAHS